MYETIDERTLRRISDGSGIPLAEGNSDYQKVLDDIISQGADCFEGDIPTELQEAADAKQFAQQLNDYTTAISRLAQYQVALGREEVVESKPTPEQVWDKDAEKIVDVMHDVITTTAIEPVEEKIKVTTYDEEGKSTTAMVENPLITQDKAERAEAQATVDATPQAVKDAA